MLPVRCANTAPARRPLPPPGPVTAPSSLPGPPQPEEASQSLDVIGRRPWQNLPKAPVAIGIKGAIFVMATRPYWVSVRPLSVSPLFLHQDLCTCRFLCSALFPRPASPHCSSLRSNLTSQKGLPHVAPAGVARPPPGPSVMPPCVYSSSFSSRCSACALTCLLPSHAAHTHVEDVRSVRAGPLSAPHCVCGT